MFYAWRFGDLEILQCLFLYNTFLDCHDKTHLQALPEYLIVILSDIVYFLKKVKNTGFLSLAFRFET